MNNKLITVFTPAYNRAYRLEALYNSLISQTSDNFCWHIIDDGSTDNTKEIADRFIAEGKIELKYEYQQNAGKHAAHNCAVKACETELFFCVDSDDELTADAVESIEKAYGEISAEKRAEISGIVAYKGYANGKIVGNEFPECGGFSSLTELYRNGKIGDTALVFRTEVIKKYPFPIFEGEHFLRENLAYDEIDKTHELCVLSKIVYVCEYLQDGLTKNATRLEMKSPRGAALFRLKEYEKTERKTEKIRLLSAYVLFSIIAGDFDKCRKEIGTLKLLCLLPLSALGYIRWHIKGAI